MKYFNCHAHCFNMHYVPDKFLKVQFNDRIANVAHWVLNQRFLSVPLLWLLKKFVRKGTSAKMIAFLSIGLKKTQDMVFEDLLANYPTEDEVAFIILPLDFTFMGAGDLNIPYEQQLEDLFELKLKNPTTCYPFVAIDPRKDTAEKNRDFVKSYIDRGFAGIKLYPALGYFSFHKGFKAVFEYAQENNIPIMTHCSSGGINYVGDHPTPEMIDPTPESYYLIPGKNYAFPQNGKKMGLYCDQFNDPNYFEEALYCFPDLKICFAHLGLNANDQIDPGNKNAFLWFNKLVGLMKIYKNVYTDISYSVAYKGFCEWFLTEYNSWPSDLQNRVLFGTDYFMTVQEVYGNDNEIISTVKKGLPADVFNKLAYDNVVAYLKKR